MDINSASPDIVLPLPYHGLKAYPYAEADVPPAARKASERAEEWNTRVVVRPMVPMELFARHPEGHPSAGPEGSAMPARTAQRRIPRRTPNDGAPRNDNSLLRACCQTDLANPRRRSEMGPTPTECSP